jgi:hypothetical protein
MVRSCACDELSRAKPFLFSLPLIRGVAKAALYCAHRTSTVSPCAFCEQEGHLAAPSLLADFYSFLLGIAVPHTCEAGGRSTGPCTEAPLLFPRDRPSGIVLILCGIPWRRVDRFEC